MVEMVSQDQLEHPVKMVFLELLEIEDRMVEMVSQEHLVLQVRLVQMVKMVNRVNVVNRDYQVHQE